MQISSNIRSSSRLQSGSLRKSGITLIELIVACAMLVVVGAGIFTLLARAWENQDAILTQNQVQSEARAALDMTCDAIRNISPWNKQFVVAYSINASSYVVGTTNFTIRRNAKKNLLNRLTAAGTAATVANITSFRLLYEGRKPGSDGKLHFETFGLNNDPNNSIYDDNLLRVETVYITVTASRKGIDGKTYACTLTTAVNARNQFYAVAPPKG